MGKRKGTPRGPLPLRGLSQVSEDESRLIFQKSIQPWMISAWTKRDFGIDATVEIVKASISIEEQTVTGKRFSVQLKSTRSKNLSRLKFPLSVPREKINYWHNSIEPVLIVYVDLKTEKLYFRWVDDELIRELNENNPSWISEKSVSITFQNEEVLCSENLLKIEEYVLHWKRPARTILTPGNYSLLSKEACALIGSLNDSVTRHRVKLFSNEVQNLVRSSAQPMYTIAVVGPTNAGKSTLINCLLKMAFSPVGVLPTTGIPIMINPSGENRITIYFKDGREISGDLSANLLEEYTSKHSNNRNAKGVKLVSVDVINLQLERGVRICDIPGLDDPDQEIRAITQTALHNVNAIMYVVSVGPMASGDFSLSNTVIDDLKQLGSRMDRLFLVFNKVELLNADQLNNLKEYVDVTLDDYGIRKYLPSLPIYLSAQDSMNKRLIGEISEDTVSVLEEQLWDFLLDSNRSGLHRIMGIFSDALQLLEKHVTIITAHKLNTAEKKKLLSEIQDIQGGIEELRKLVAQERSELQEAIKEFLHNSVNYKLEYLKGYLNSIPSNLSLPTNKSMSIWLQDNALEVLSKTNSEVQQRMYELQSTVNHWVSKKLKQITMNLSNDNEFDSELPDIQTYVNQIDQFIYRVKMSPIGILESLFHQFDNLFNWLEKAFTPSYKVRQKMIDAILRNSRSSYTTISNRYIGHIDFYLSKKCRLIEERTIDRTNVYLNQLSNRLAEVREIDSNGETDVDFDTFLAELTRIKTDIRKNLMYLKNYTDDFPIIR